MKREGRALGADAMVNLRFTTSQVMAGAAARLRSIFEARDHGLIAQ